LDSLAVSVPRLFLDVKSEQENQPFGICGKTEQTADSLEVNSFNKKSRPVKPEDLIHGLRLLDASEVQSSLRKD